VSKTMTHGPLGFRIIGGFKILGSLALFAAGIGVFRLMRSDVAETLENLAETWRLDPNSRYIDSFISWAGNIDHKHLKAIGFGTFFYAALYAVEGLGLVFERRWAGYLTVIATGSLIPLEVWEVYKKTTPTRLSVLAINVAILVYLVWKLVQEHRAYAREDAASASPA
jgi:uncharacterized membrane protein (DUF2068 family)